MLAIIALSLRSGSLNRIGEKMAVARGRCTVFTAVDCGLKQVGSSPSMVVRPWAIGECCRQPWRTHR
ncbi:hypothetical protein KCP78_02320 [Salmonella enterica subsp. enterica]|nr:hypothetical protein KCP78_02320 [Salmonella enterica subsp. enterica]